jgi:class 3 adenylate cyclase/tetratricopeptide (TPR) repeat protein
MTSTPSGTVTFLFTDVEGSTRRWEAHLVVMQEAMARHDTIVRTSIEANAGTVFTTAGDEFCSAFSSPHDALSAAIEIQIKLAAEEWGDVAPFLVRMALHTGIADERDGDYFGPPLNRCARLLSIGHGGQVLMSAITAQLLGANPPAGASLGDLGAHVLKDLDDPEHVFQVTHPELPSEFLPLRSTSPVRDAADLLAEGRQAHAAQEWEAAYQALSAAGQDIELDSEDLQRLGGTAFWTGRTDEAVTIKEKAYGKLTREGKTVPAALTALDLAFLYKYRLATAVSKAWVARAEKLVRDAEGTEAHGYLLRWQSVYAFESEGKPEKALALADEAIAVGVGLCNRSIEALALMDKGRFLVAMGRVDEGMTLVDESMVAAVSGELDPDATGRNYCNMLSVCDQVADYQRAAEWSDAAEAWCRQHSDSAYPGICRVFRAELKWLRGDWEAATEDLHRAVDELSGYTPIIGAALYQIGEVELRAGKLPEAETHFRSAHEHGFTPLPGIAQLRLIEGDATAAERLLLDALADNPQPLDRAKYLPVLIDTELELGNLTEARTFLIELEGTAELCYSEAMRAQAAERRAALAVSEGRPQDAIQDLQAAVKGWMGLQMPFEAAQSRLRLGGVFQSSGNEAAASMEIESANATLGRLGSTHN